MRNNLKKIVRAGSALVVVAGITAASVMPAQAFFFMFNEEQRAHLMTCLNLAATDSELHKLTCLTNRNNPNINPGVANQTPPQPMKYEYPE